MTTKHKADVLDFEQKKTLVGKVGKSGKKSV